MKEKVKISIDLMGGENSPNKTLEGINLFMKRNKKIDDYFFYLFGEKKIVEEKIKKIPLLENNYELIDTKIIVSKNYI